MDSIFVNGGLPVYSTEDFFNILCAGKSICITPGSEWCIYVYTVGEKEVVYLHCENDKIQERCGAGTTLSWFKDCGLSHLKILNEHNNNFPIIYMRSSNLLFSIYKTK